MSCSFGPLPLISATPSPHSRPPDESVELNWPVAWWLEIIQLTRWGLIPEMGHPQINTNVTGALVPPYLPCSTLAAESRFRI